MQADARDEEEILSKGRRQAGSRCGSGFLLSRYSHRTLESIRAHRVHREWVREATTEAITFSCIVHATTAGYPRHHTNPGDRGWIRSCRFWTDPCPLFPEAWEEGIRVAR